MWAAEGGQETLALARARVSKQLLGTIHCAESSQEKHGELQTVSE